VSSARKNSTQKGTHLVDRRLDLGTLKKLLGASDVEVGDSCDRNFRKQGGKTQPCGKQNLPMCFTFPFSLTTEKFSCLLGI